MRKYCLRNLMGLAHGHKANKQQTWHLPLPSTKQQQQSLDFHLPSCFNSITSSDHWEVVSHIDLNAENLSLLFQEVLFGFVFVLCFVFVFQFFFPTQNEILFLGVEKWVSDGNEGAAHTQHTCCPALVCIALAGSPWTSIFHVVNFRQTPCPSPQRAFVPPVSITKKNAMQLEIMDFELDGCVATQFLYQYLTLRTFTNLTKTYCPHSENEEITYN